jgi:hypothetical protein
VHFCFINITNVKNKSSGRKTSSNRKFLKHAQEKAKKNGTGPYNEPKKHALEKTANRRSLR